MAENWKIKVFYDGDCPLCRREIDFLRKRDARGLLKFENIADPHFVVPADEHSPSFNQLMAELHGRYPDGTWIKGVDVFREMYQAIGWTWLVTLSKWPVVRNLLNVGYKVFARYRLKLFGRCDADGCRPSTVGSEATK